MCTWNLPRAFTMGWTSSFRLWESSDPHSHSLARNHLSFDLVCFSSSCTPLVPHCGSGWLHHLRKVATEGVGKITIFGPHSQHTHKHRVRKERQKKAKKERQRRRRWHVISCELFSLRSIAARVKCCHHEIYSLSARSCGPKEGISRWNFVVCVMQEVRPYES